MTTHGRNRQSIADIETALENIFSEHPDSTVNVEGQYVVPAAALPDIIRVFSDNYSGVELMSEGEIDQLRDLVVNNPGIEATPGLLLGFIAQKTKESPPEDETITLPRQNRGRNQDREEYNDRGRESSSDSVGTSTYSRNPSRGPQTPKHNGFDSEKRQRSTPLGAAPSSWATKRPAPASRRKSDAGSGRGGSSDSESWNSGPPVSFGRGGPPGRSRAPSNPTSPASGAFSPEPHSRPHSRTQSQPQGFFHRDEYERDSTMSPEHREAFSDSVSSMPMPRGNDSDYDDSDEEGLVLDRDADTRSILSSNASMEPQDRLEALQRTNADLGRKLSEAERTLQKKLSDHEVEVEDLQNHMEEVRTELGAAKREEKELRSKERQNSSTISELELEIAKLQKTVEHAKTNHQSLQKQYHEQLGESERYRNSLRYRDDEVKDYIEASALHQLEINKFLKENEKYEERIAHLAEDLALAQQAHEDLDKQKAMNIELKETIDRARFELDILRNRDSGGGSGSSSVQNSIGKSLGAELKGKMSGRHGFTGQDDTDEEDDTEGEEEYTTQTIVTRKKAKRKIPGRNRPETTSATFEEFEETKEYVDASVQHEDQGFTSTMETQTEPEPELVVVPKVSSSIQTDEVEVEVITLPPLPRVMAEMEIQTEPQPSRSPSPTVEDDDDATLASSSSTVLPATPKASTSALPSGDSPPAYHLSEKDKANQEWSLAQDMLRKWHTGPNCTMGPASGGLSAEAIEEWKALKAELGVDCAVIDKIVEASSRRPSPRSPRKGRFYNIYNTYVYGSKKDGTPPSFPTSALTQLLMCVGASAVMCIALVPYMIPQYNIPGGPTWHDRAAFTAFNSMRPAVEGFSGDGTSAVWSFLGRVTTGAVHAARGLPT